MKHNFSSQEYDKQGLQHFPGTSSKGKGHQDILSPPCAVPCHRLTNITSRELSLSAEVIKTPGGSFGTTSFLRHASYKNEDLIHMLDAFCLPLRSILHTFFILLTWPIWMQALHHLASGGEMQEVRGQRKYTRGLDSQPAPPTHPLLSAPLALFLH